jgi:hypothetical protein
VSMQSEEPGNVPVETVRVAQAAFPKGSLAIRIRDELGVLFTDEQFVDLHPDRPHRRQHHRPVHRTLRAAQLRRGLGQQDCDLPERQDHRTVARRALTPRHPCHPDPVLAQGLPLLPRQTPVHQLSHPATPVNHAPAPGRTRSDPAGPRHRGNPPMAGTLRGPQRHRRHHFPRGPSHRPAPMPLPRARQNPAPASAHRSRDQSRPPRRLDHPHPPSPHAHLPPGSTSPRQAQTRRGELANGIPRWEGAVPACRG